MFVNDNVNMHTTLTCHFARTVIAGLSNTGQFIAKKSPKLFRLDSFENPNEKLELSLCTDIYLNTTIYQLFQCVSRII